MKYAKYELVMRKLKVHEDVAEYKVRDTDELHQFIHNILKLQELPEERFYVILFDTKGKITGYSEVCKGTIDACDAAPREVFKLAVVHNAASIAVAHNHPSEDPAPSHMDIVTTERLVQAGKILGIQLVDHMIIGGDTYISLREQNMIDNR